MQAGMIVKTKLGLAVVIKESTYGTAGMRCLLVHQNKSMHRATDEIEVMMGWYVSSWGAIIILPEFIEDTYGSISSEELLELSWLLRLRDEGYHYEVWGPHPLCSFRCDTHLSWNPIHIPSVFRSLDEMELM